MTRNTHRRDRYHDYRPSWQCTNCGHVHDTLVERCEECRSESLSQIDRW